MKLIYGDSISIDSTIYTYNYLNDTLLVIRSHENKVGDAFDSLFSYKSGLYKRDVLYGTIYNLSIDSLSEITREIDVSFGTSDTINYIWSHGNIVTTTYRSYTYSNQYSILPNQLGDALQTQELINFRKILYKNKNLIVQQQQASETDSYTYHFDSSGKISSVDISYGGTTNPAEMYYYQYQCK